jgi:MFS family permease
LKADGLAALRYPEFRMLWLGQGVSLWGTHMQRAAIAWQIYILTHDPLALGLLGVFRFLPMVSLSLVGGLVADTADRKRVMIITQLAMLAAALLLAVATYAGQASPPLIYAAVFVTAAAAAFDSPSRQSLMPRLVPESVYPNAVSLNSMIGETARILGPTVSGFLIAGTGSVGLIYALNAASFLAVILALANIRTRVRAEVSSEGISLAALAEGFRYMKASPVVMGAMIMDFFAAFFGSSGTLLPVFASDVLQVGPEGYGLLVAAPSVGALITSAAMSARRLFERPGLVMMYGVALYGITTIFFGLSTSFLLSLFFFALTGAGDVLSTILRQVIRQLATPDHLRGRMTSINMIFAFGGPQLGEVEAGVAASLWGAPLAVITGGIGCLVAVAVAARFAPALRDYRSPTGRRADPPASVPAGPASP